MKLIKPSYKILTKINGNNILKAIERSGRVCYKSENKITADSAKKFVANLIKNQHLSVLEHQGFTVKFIIDRGIGYELVRHRLCSFSQESSRYCTYQTGCTFIIPPWHDIKPGTYIDTSYVIDNIKDFKSSKWAFMVLSSEINYLTLLNDGEQPQQARSVLPNSLKTEIDVTANLREWRHIFTLRCSKAAHPQMREIMIPLLTELKKKIPIVFDDIHGDSVN